MKPVVLLLLLHFFKTPYAVSQGTFAAASRFTPAPGFYEKNIATLQRDSSKGINKKKLYLIAGVHAASYAGTMLVLGKAWYDDYSKTGFHLFNDSNEWLQLDKAGHAWTAYNIANYSTRLWKGTGLSRRNAALLGGFSSLGYQTILEFLDAHSAEWGWSWADIGANAAGAALFTTQELTWGFEKVALKFSSFPQRHDASLRPRAAELFGRSFPERLLKDYNGQTYWLSLNLESVFHSNLPSWLNLAVGYGGDGMYGGFENIAVDKTGAVVFDRRDVARVRQWYLSPDVDWTKLKTNKKLVRTLFSLLNMIKLPAPALELRRGKLKPHWIRF